MDTLDEFADIDAKRHSKAIQRFHRNVGFRWRLHATLDNFEVYTALEKELVNTMIKW